tara:strand:+ start:456 stop:641 length:186 start_codon:yes stop_codon:yes gene_type:complete
MEDNVSKAEYQQLREDVFTCIVLYARSISPARGVQLAFYDGLMDKLLENFDMKKKDKDSKL